MATNRRRGDISSIYKTDGVFRTPEKSGFASSGQSSPWKDKTVDTDNKEATFKVYDPPIPQITNYEYVPYGGHYELPEALRDLSYTPTGDVGGDPFAGRFFIQSHPYPPVTSDLMTVSQALIGVRFGNTYVNEEISASYEITGGSVLTYIYTTYNMVPEELSSVYEILSGSAIHYIYTTYEMVPEEITSACEILGGSVVIYNYLVYENWPLIPEQTTSAMTILGGSVA